MKRKFSLALIGVVYSLTILAQKGDGHILKLHLGVLNKVKVAYEVPLSDVFSVGATGGDYFLKYPGLKLEPFLRYYIGGEAPSGLYLQARGAYGSFSPELIYYAPEFFSNLSAITEKKSVSSMGGGLDLGYQWLSGRNKNIAIDISLGAQIMQDVNGTIRRNNVEYTSANVGFNSTGPGALFNPRLSIGYRF